MRLLRLHRPPPPNAVRTFSFSVSVTFPRITRSAGASPNRIPVRIQTPRVNPSTLESGLTLRGTYSAPFATRVTRAVVAQLENNRPAATPHHANNMLPA